jgi:hypothetical protein
MRSEFLLCPLAFISLRIPWVKCFQDDHGVECALYDMRNRDALVMTKRSVVMVK